MFLRPFLRRAFSTLLEETEATVIHNIKRFENVKGDSVSRTSTFTDLGLDSLDAVELVVECEHLLGVDLEEEEAIKISTVSELVAALMKKRQAK
mmetsp:Transcript_7385/g.13742  ORF Transcript_7385/g.13742 Transcript_7385/m.13742 type:complete len:94 (+) Transcript_7385:2069-2350(+)